VAVDLAKVSLWLVTLARDHALTFVDHALRHGDALVGLSRKQIEAFHWEADAPRFREGFETMRVREHVAKAAELRRRIREADDSVSDWALRDLWDEAQFELGKVRLFGDLVLGAFLQGEKPKEREQKRSEYATAVVNGEAERYRGWLEEWRQGDPPLAPFHWEIEFPEVFERERPGFDALVGNPPFMGGTMISTSLGDEYLAWLKSKFVDAGNRMDLVAYFIRQGFALLRREGALGFVATNTIAQGDTRFGGLRWICNHGGAVYSVRRRVKWPGTAAVIVSPIHIWNGTLETPPSIDGRVVEHISAFLCPHGGNEDPVRLYQNGNKCFEGFKPAGQGFLFADGDEEASPISEMMRLVDADRKNQERIFPYIGGEELNDSPVHAHHRYAINFAELAEHEARRWPLLMEIVEQRVKPYRDTVKRDAHRERWWRYGETRPGLTKALNGVRRVIANSQVSARHAFAFLPTGMVYSHTLNVFLLETHAAFCALQARPHEIWARFFGSSMKDDLRYTPSDCFETFPFPESWETHPALEAAGNAYYEFRGALMVENDEGLTKTYNRFHDPDELDPDILGLRELHAAMDRAVLNAYGWRDIPTDCKFLLDYEIDEDEWGDKKRPWRCRWPDEVRDEVLARLLELNAGRAKEEARSGAAAAKKRGRKAAVKRTLKASNTGDLF
jgi:hypothetical protein